MLVTTCISDRASRVSKVLHSLLLSVVYGGFDILEEEDDQVRITVAWWRADAEFTTANTGCLKRVSSGCPSLALEL